MIYVKLISLDRYTKFSGQKLIKKPNNFL